MIEVREVDSLDVPWLMNIKDRISLDGQVYKWCPYLGGHWSPVEEFYNNRTKADGLGSYCKTCGKDHMKGRKERLQERPSLLKKQNNKCGFCGIDLTQLTTANFITVDHDHKTGITRKVVCVNCNTGLSKFGDSSLRMFYGGFYIIYYRLKYYFLKAHSTLV